MLTRTTGPAQRAESCATQPQLVLHETLGPVCTSRSPHPPPEEHVKRLLLCSGKVYYDLNKKRAEKGLQKDIAIVRLEQVRLC